MTFSALPYLINKSEPCSLKEYFKSLKACSRSSSISSEKPTNDCCKSRNLVQREAKLSNQYVNLD